MGAEKFHIVQDDAETKPLSVGEKIGIEALQIGLGALSQRAIAGLSKLFTLLTVASAFALWWNVLPNPSIYQLVGLTIYAVFLIIVNWLVRR